MTTGRQQTLSVLRLILVATVAALITGWLIVWVVGAHIDHIIANSMQ